MDFQAAINAMNAADQKLRSGYHLTLGDAVQHLESMDSLTPVEFDDGLLPSIEEGVRSYRGYYSDLAIDSEAFGAPVTAGELAIMLRSAIGETFYGYKGGEYIMTESTPLWRASYGCCGLAITGLEIQGGKAVLATKEVD
jgi:hypothetical protein